MPLEATPKRAAALRPTTRAWTRLINDAKRDETQAQNLRDAMTSYNERATRVATRRRKRKSADATPPAKTVKRRTAVPNAPAAKPAAPASRPVARPSATAVPDRPTAKPVKRRAVVSSAAPIDAPPAKPAGRRAAPRGRSSAALPAAAVDVSVDAPVDASVSAPVDISVDPSGEASVDILVDGSVIAPAVKSAPKPVKRYPATATTSAVNTPDPKQVKSQSAYMPAVTVNAPVAKPVICRPAAPPTTTVPVSAVQASEHAPGYVPESAPESMKPAEPTPGDEFAVLATTDTDWNDRLSALSSFATRALTSEVADAVAPMLAVQAQDLRSRIVSETAVAVAAGAELYSPESARVLFDAAAASVTVAKKVMSVARERVAFEALRHQSDHSLWMHVADCAVDAAQDRARQLCVDCLTRYAVPAQCDGLSRVLKRALISSAVDKSLAVRAASRELYAAFREKNGSGEAGALLAQLPALARSRLTTASKPAVGARPSRLPTTAGPRAVGKAAAMGSSKPAAARGGRPSVREVIRMKRLEKKKAEEAQALPVTTVDSEANSLSVAETGVAAVDEQDGGITDGPEAHEEAETGKKRQTSEVQLSARKDPHKKRALTSGSSNGVAAVPLSKSAVARTRVGQLPVEKDRSTNLERKKSEGAQALSEVLIDSSGDCVPGVLTDTVGVEAPAGGAMDSHNAHEDTETGKKRQTDEVVPSARKDPQKKSAVSDATNVAAAVAAPSRPSHSRTRAGQPSLKDVIRMKRIEKKKAEEAKALAAASIDSAPDSLAGAVTDPAAVDVPGGDATNGPKTQEGTETGKKRQTNEIMLSGRKDPRKKRAVSSKTNKNKENIPNTSL